ncbi:MAG: zinc ribbon domain-containing protein [Planctomycetota bacterium]|nr:MAG: zinc ribbon domain-containing protein [Planctomycetota bacterium]
MIPCQECGHINRLGAIYCGACGAKLEVDLEIIEQSVIASSSQVRAEKYFLAGRNIIGLGVFLFISAWLLQSVIIPQPPSFQLPQAPPMSPNDIFNPEVEWIQPTLDIAPRLRLEDVLAQRSPSLLEWRAAYADTALGDVNRERITHWQVEIFNSRRSDGSWLGGDPVAATGIAILALLAHPGPESFAEAIEQGINHIHPLVLAGSSGRNPIAHTIGIMALVESGRLSERELSVLRPALYRGDAPHWQAMALLSFSPDDRPKRIAAIRSHTTDSLWRHFLHFLSDQPLIDSLDESLFVANAGERLQGIDRLAWACLAFWMGRDVDGLRESLQRWSSLDDVPTANAELRSLAGPHADWAMAVLTATAPLRAPIPWIRPASEP